MSTTPYKHLGQIGIEQLLALLATEFDKIVYAEEGKGLSTNDLTAELLAKLNGIEEGANKYTHATHTAFDANLYKVQVDAEGHVIAATAVAKDDITALGIPGQDTTYVVATQSKEGLMSADDKTKLDGIAENANNYVHATHTPAASGFYKVTVDSEGHVSAVTAVTKEDIVALGIPAQDTTYAEATEEAAGLMSAADKKTINGLGSLASKSEVAEADLNAELKTKVNAAAEGNHAHVNKELLDTYDQTNADIKDAVAKKHAHANQTELDKIADGDVAKWNAAEQNAKDHADGLNTAMDTRVKALESDNTTNKQNITAVTNAANANKTAIETLNGNETTEGSVAKTVKDYVATKIASVYKAGGSVAFADIPTASAENEGYVYNITEDFTTDAEFIEGAGKKYKAGTNVVVIEASEGQYMYDVLAMSLDGLVQEADITEYSADEITTMWNSVFTA